MSMNRVIQPSFAYETDGGPLNPEYVKAQREQRRYEIAKAVLAGMAAAGVYDWDLYRAGRAQNAVAEADALLAELEK